MREDFHQQQAFGAAPAGHLREKTMMMRDRHEDHIPEVIVTKVSILIGCTLSPEICYFFVYNFFSENTMCHS